MVQRHRRTHDGDQKSKKSSGLLSHVFSFVSREFESFVLNATASQPARVKRRARDSERNASEDQARYMSRAQHRRERERRSKHEPSRRKPRSNSNSTDTTTQCRQNHLKTTHIDDDRVLSASDRERSNSPTPQPSTVFPVPQLPQLKKKPSITMPGSLFPRSPSLVPDMDHRTQASSYGVQPLHPGFLGAGPSGSHFSNADSGDPSQPCLDDYVSPWRTRRIASVKDAVTRFNATDGVEADFSLMLPSPHSSPTKTISHSRSVEEPTSTPTPLPTASRKGKERARDRNDDDLDFIVVGTSGHDDVHAKERELDVARQEQREHERLLNGNQSRRASDERERDKRRIKALEEEVRWLKEELSRSQIRTSPPPSLVPPPPPPPPLPPLPLRIDTAPYTPTSMFATARASLRHAMTPIEAPINDPGHRTKRQGQPTVNVPSEKMAAFLQEIMTAKLRKVRSGANAMGGDGVAGPSGLSKSVSVTSSSSTGLTAQELKRRRSLASLRVPIGSSLAAPMSLSASATVQEMEARVGEKRKVDALGHELVGAPSKRRMTQSSAPSSVTNQHTSSSSSERSPRSSFALPPLTHPTNETDVTTPSLCSDNDRDENSIEDQAPSTPPGPRIAAATQKGSKTDTRQEDIDVIDVDMEEQPRPTPVPNSVPRRTSQLFKKRPPMSPIPIPTPRRPSAPARTKRGATPKPKSALPMESDVDDEDGGLSQSAPVPFLSLIPVPKSKPTGSKGKPPAGKSRSRAVLPQQTSRSSTSSTSGSSSQNKRKKAHKRRQTLDEELRVAEARSSDIDECNDELDREEKEEDVFVATGIMSKRKGFLAHGGGGGTPVFMGVGYVEGTAPDSEDEDEVPSAQPRRPTKSNQPSFIPRPKARS